MTLAAVATRPVANTLPEWWSWEHPDYERIWRDRGAKLKALRARPGMWAPLRESYASDPIAFINDWATTYDPRNVDTERPTMMPFLLFEKQAEFIEWTRQRWMRREDGLVEKSSDMGVSWCCVAFAVWLWRFHPSSVLTGLGAQALEHGERRPW